MTVILRTEEEWVRNDEAMDKLLDMMATTTANYIKASPRRRLEMARSKQLRDQLDRINRELGIEA